MPRCSRSTTPRIASALICVLLLAGLPALSSTTPSTDADVADQQAVASTDRLLELLKQQRSAAPEQRAARLAQLVESAAKRRERMLALLALDPRQVSLRAMPAALRDRLPEAARALVEESVRASGDVQGMVAEDFARQVAQHRFYLRVPGEAQSYELHLEGTGLDPAALLGKKVTVTALRLDKHLVVQATKDVQLMALGGTTTTSSATTALVTTAPIQGDRQTLLVLGNFSDVALSCSAADLGAKVFGVTGATTNVQYQESSRGSVSFSGRSVGPFALPYASTSACDLTAWSNAAEAAAKAAGIDTSQYQHVSYVTPKNPSCGFTGMGEMPGRRSWVMGCVPAGVFAHELGHNLGFNHAATAASEYGDLSDAMGGNAVVQAHGPNHVHAGWLPPGAFTDVSSGGSYALAALELTAPASPQVLRIAKPDTAEYYYVSLRQPIGLDAGLWSTFQNAVSVHRSAGSLSTRSYLLQNLLTGQTFSDTANGISITMQGLAGNTATLGITIGGASCTRAAPSVTLSPASQTSTPGSTLVYSVAVKNQSSAACASSVFGLGSTVPAGFTATLGAASLTVAPGATATTSWSVASAATVPNATYTLTLAATDAGSGATTTAQASDIVYTEALPACTRGSPAITVSPAAQTGAAGSALSYGVSVTNLNSAACGSASFNLSQIVPAGFAGTYGATSLVIAAGSSAATTWVVASPSSAAGGTYPLTAQVREGAAGALVSGAGSFTIAARDSTPPSLAITSPAANTAVGNRVTISATANDASGVQAVEFYIDGVLIGRNTAAPYTATWSSRKAAVGGHTIRVRAIDNAGNAAEQSISVTK